jgi:hypothetical protein
MPYFRCSPCVLRLYSAASRTRCTECGAPLGEAEQLRGPTPPAWPRRQRRSVALATHQPADLRRTR